MAPGQFFSTTCRQRAGDHDHKKSSILRFLAHNMAIWSLPRKPQRNSTRGAIFFCPKRSYQVRFAKVFHFQDFRLVPGWFQVGRRRRRRRRLMTTGSLARCLPLTHPGVTYPVRGYPSLRQACLRPVPGLRRDDSLFSCEFRDF